MVKQPVFFNFENDPSLAERTKLTPAQITDLWTFELSSTCFQYNGLIYEQKEHEHAHDIGHKPLWNELKFIDRDPSYYTRWVKEATHIRLHPNNINRDSGIEILEAWMPTIKNTTTGDVRQRSSEGANHWVNSMDRNAPIRAFNIL